MPSAKWRVLIADDEPAARRGVRQLLASFQAFEVVGECRDGAEVLASLDALHPDVVFLDIQMPGLSGFDVIRRRTPDHMPAVVFLTAYDQFALSAFDAQALRRQVEHDIGASFDGTEGELAFARAVLVWQGDAHANADRLDAATRYAAWAAHTRKGRARHRRGVLLRAPRKLDFLNLVPVMSAPRDGVPALAIDEGHALRRREGFALTDDGTDLVGALDEAHYCIWCHEQGKDSCSRGLFEKTPADGVALADPYKRSVFGVPLTGSRL